MNCKRLIIATIILSLSLDANAASIKQNKTLSDYTTQTIADTLGWISSTTLNSCAGYYTEPLFIHTKPSPIKHTPITITAKKPAIFTKYGISKLEGNVKISQPGREIAAEEITLFRDSKTEKVTNADLFRNVELQEHGKLLAANAAHIDFVKNSVSLTDAIYRLVAASDAYQLNAWGRAKKLERDEQGLLSLYEGSYTTCPPTNCAWRIAAKKITIDKDKNIGKASGVKFYIRNIPVIYIPSHSFPINRDRKTGFLYPSITYSAANGIGLGVPFYLNIALNRDLTLTPNYLTKRGLLTSGLFRYLTYHGAGTINLSYIPYDKSFVTFRDDAPFLYPKAPSQSMAELKKSGPNRGRFSTTNSFAFNEHFSGSFIANYISDDYFLQDFGETPEAIDTDQLLNQADVSFSSNNWHFTALFQGFQTLHPVNQTTLIKNQYTKLPQLDLAYDLEKAGIIYHLNSQFVNFEHSKDYQTGLPVTTGERLNIAPTITYPIIAKNYYFRPQAQLDLANYELQNQKNLAPRDISRITPIISLNSGALFSRQAKFFNNSYLQILEPKIFYLYVPIKNQSDIPIFDTTLPPFDFGQLFRTNRFSGIDRVGDANQVSLAIITRLLNPLTGEEKLHAGIGQIYSFHYHTICEDKSCALDPLSHNKVSPLVGELQYSINSKWNFDTNLGFEPNTRELNQTSFAIQYLRDKEHIINFGYNFVRDGDPELTVPKNLSRFNFSIAWPIKTNWKLLGNWNYNISHDYPQTFLYGLEYESCCFAMRLVQNRSYIGQNLNGETHFNNTFYLQFLLKGLGNFGNSDAGTILSGSISNYQDNFATGLRL